MSITIIAAMNEKRAIGKEGKLPWHIPSELRHFKQSTIYKPVIMGSNTFHNCLKKNPLPDRLNIVVKMHPAEKKDVRFVPSFEFALDITRTYDETVVIGGSSIYEQALPFADKMILSVIDIEVEGADKFFPQWNKEEWRLSESKRMANEGEPIYFIETWERRK